MAVPCGPVSPPRTSIRLSAVAKARQVPSMVGQDLASVVSTTVPYQWVDNQPDPIDTETHPMDAGIWQHKGDKLSVVAFDFGIKYNIIRSLTQKGAEVIVVPAATTAEQVRAMDPGRRVSFQRPRRPRAGGLRR